MRLDRLPTSDAAGALLVHSVTVDGRKFAKGRVLSAEDLAALTQAGIETVFAARFDADDVGEDAAANAIALAASGANVKRQAAFTGRANLYAECAGLALLERERIDGLNLIDEAITIATVPPYAVIAEGQMLATVKIIPFAVRGDLLAEAERLARGNDPLVCVVPFSGKKAGLIMTTLVGTKDKVLDKTVRIVADRLAPLQAELAAEQRCAHERAAIAEAIRAQRAQGCNPILVFGASAITDRRDEVPAGIELAGGEIEHFGMPVDPGNLLLLARHGDVPVIGLPGCARSPKLNGFDWVLQRLCADLPVRARDLMGMGAGGLLQEYESRPQPRRGKRAAPAEVAKLPKIAAVILAAGQSRRMGAANKLLADVDGRTMLRHAVESARAAALAKIMVVTGHEAAEVRASLSGHDVQFVDNPLFADGLSTSLKAGLDALAEGFDGVLVMLGDMPRVRADHIDKLVSAFNPVEGRAICVPTYRGKRGNPVLFAIDLIGEMKAVAGDAGAKHLIGEHEDQVAEVAMGDDAVLLDIDTPDALAALQ